jgi:hypothetical protein
MTTAISERYFDKRSKISSYGSAAGLDFVTG